MSSRAPWRCGQRCRGRNPSRLSPVRPRSIDMLRYALARLLATIPVVVMTSIIIFALMRLLPGDPVNVLIGQAHVDVSAETIAQLRKDLGLDKSIPVQYLAWLRRAVTGDFG